MSSKTMAVAAAMLALAMPVLAQAADDKVETSATYGCKLTMKRDADSKSLSVIFYPYEDGKLSLNINNVDVKLSDNDKPLPMVMFSTDNKHSAMADSAVWSVSSFTHLIKAKTTTPASSAKFVNMLKGAKSLKIGYSGNAVDIQHGLANDFAYNFLKDCLNRQSKTIHI